MGKCKCCGTDEETGEYEIIRVIIQVNTVMKEVKCVVKIQERMVMAQTE